MLLPPSYRKGKRNWCVLPHHLDIYHKRIPETYLYIPLLRQKKKVEDDAQKCMCRDVLKSECRALNSLMMIYWSKLQDNPSRPNFAIKRHKASPYPSYA